MLPAQWLSLVCGGYASSIVYKMEWMWREFQITLSPRPWGACWLQPLAGPQGCSSVLQIRSSIHSMSSSHLQGTLPESQWQKLLHIRQTIDVSPAGRTICGIRQRSQHTSLILIFLSKAECWREKSPSCDRLGCDPINSSTQLSRLCHAKMSLYLEQRHLYSHYCSGRPPQELESAAQKSIIWKPSKLNGKRLIKAHSYNVLQRT